MGWGQVVFAETWVYVFLVFLVFETVSETRLVSHLLFEDDDLEFLILLPIPSALPGLQVYITMLGLCYASLCILGKCPIN